MVLDLAISSDSVLTPKDGLHTSVWLKDESTLTGFKSSILKGMVLYTCGFTVSSVSVAINQV